MNSRKDNLLEVIAEAVCLKPTSTTSTGYGANHTYTSDVPKPKTPKAQPSRSKLEDWEPHIYYDWTKKEALVLNNSNDWIPVTEHQLQRQCKVRGMQTEWTKENPITRFDYFFADLQMQRGVQYAGPLAGRLKGPRMVNNMPILVTSSPKFPEPKAGEWPLIRALVEGMLASGEHDQTVYFYGWMSCGLVAYRTGINKPGQALVLAGPREAGKTLMQNIITACFGGREAKPFSYMMGKTDFNSQILGAEHLRLDDEAASTDIRTRREFGSRIKELLFSPIQRMHRKGREEMTLDPIWRMSISVNNEPEHLMVLPPLEESIDDKLILLSVEKNPMPMPTDTPEQYEALSTALMAEIPAFVHFLVNEFQIPADERNPRCGIRFWHHPDVVAAIRELSPQTQLLSLFDRLRVASCWEGTAAELQAELFDSDSSGIRAEAMKLLAWPNACGTYLGRLAHEFPERVERVRTATERKWLIYPAP